MALPLPLPSHAMAQQSIRAAAFYDGRRDARRGVEVNPYSHDIVLAAEWAAGVESVRDAGAEPDQGATGTS